jgi:hypothetical protein
MSEAITWHAHCDRYVRFLEKNIYRKRWFMKNTDVRQPHLLSITTLGNSEVNKNNTRKFGFSLRDFRLPQRRKRGLRFFGNVMQHRTVVSCRRFRTKYPSNLQGSSSPRISVRNYRSMLWKIPKQRNLLGPPSQKTSSVTVYKDKPPKRLNVAHNPCTDPLDLAV